MGKKAVLLALLFLSLAACSPLQKIEQPLHTNLQTLSSESSLGQSFVARYDGLQALLVYLEPGSPASGKITLDLFAGPEMNEKLRTAELPAEAVAEPGNYRFLFTSIDASHNQYYYVQFTLKGQGSLQAGAAGGDTYMSGALHQNNTPQNAQLAFSLEHNARLAWIGLLGEGFTWAFWLILAGLLFVVPGWALLDLLWPSQNPLHWAEKLSLAGGISLALYPLLLLWTDLVGLHLGALYAWLPPILGLAALTWHHRQDLARFATAIRAKRRWSVPLGSISWADLTLLVVMALIFATRFWAMRSLEAPMWGDSYQHTMIAQLIVDNNGLFDSWQPYAEMTSFTYHFGFHSAVAAFHWLSGLPMHTATLCVGQILNGMAAIFLIPLALRMRRNLWAGVATVLVAGLLLTMPMFYTNWGRYTQLTAQAILPAMVCLAWVTLETQPSSKRMLALSSIILGGLALTHYRLLILSLCFYIAFIMINFKRVHIRSMLMRTLWTGLGAGVLFLPWLWHLSDGQIPAIANSFLHGPVNSPTTSPTGHNAIGDITRYLPALVWLGLPVLAGFGLWRRNRSVALISIWWLVNFLTTNPQMILLPGAGLISNFTLFLAAYIPAALLIGETVGWLVDSLQCHLERRHTSSGNARASLSLSLALTLSVIALAFWGARQRLWDVQPPAHALVTRPDLRAASWIDANIPQEARFLVNAQFAYDHALIVGSDGGWWLPLLAHRQTNLPPLPYSFERGPMPGYIEWINAPVEQIYQDGLDHPITQQMLGSRDITYIYIGQQQGRVNSAAALITPQQLLASPNFRLVYYQDRVWIFKRKLTTRGFQTRSR